MKIYYIFQLEDFLILFLFGFLIGIIYEILNIPTITKKRIVYQIIIDILFSALFGIVFVFLVNHINMGETRAFLLIGYLIGFLLERIIIGKLFAKGYKKVYNAIIKWIKKFKENKIGRFLFK